MLNCKGRICWVAASLLMAAAGTASAAETASATISSAPSGNAFKYTIQVTNTSTDGSNIGTFWFSWTLVPDLSYMEIKPTSITLPKGWVSLISGLNTATDGSGIETFDEGGATDLLTPGNTDTFSFVSTEPLTQILGPSTIGAHLAETTSFVYAGMPESDAGFEFQAATVPEPVSASMLVLLGGGLLMRRSQA
jgi:hypothetical protein